MRPPEPPDPVDLTAVPTERTATGGDLAAALRAALDAGGERTPDVHALLVGVHGRARAIRRRRTAAGAGAVLAAAAAVVGVVSATGLPSTTTPPVGPARHPAPPTTASSTADPNATALPAPPVLSADAVLRTGDVTAFGAAGATGTTPAAAGDGGPVVAGVCTDGVLGVGDARSTARGDWSATSTAATATARGTGLVEQVWRFDDTRTAAEAVAQLASQVAGCAGHTQEGQGAPVRLDASALAPDGGSALATTASDGDGGRLLSVWLARGATLVQLQVTYAPGFTLGPGASGDAVTTGAQALDAAAGTARAAIERATAS